MAVFTNYATLTYSGGATNSNTVVGELVESLTATKTAVSPGYSPGDTVTYTLSLVNSGTTALTIPTITDDLGGYLYNSTTVYPLTYVANSLQYYVNGVLQTAPTVTAGPPMTVSNITVPAGGNAMIVYETTVNNYAPPSSTGSITNTVTVNTADTLSTLTATADVAAETASNLNISKALSPAVVTENGQVTYTFVIENTGNKAAVATDNVTLTDTFSPILSNITVTYNNAAWAVTTNYTYDETTGQFATVPGQITVPAATFTQNTDGSWTTTPGISTLVITGTV